VGFLDMKFAYVQRKAKTQTHSTEQNGEQNAKECDPGCAINRENLVTIAPYCWNCEDGCDI
jgi:hypothetical protein